MRNTLLSISIAMQFTPAFANASEPQFSDMVGRDQESDLLSPSGHVGIWVPSDKGVVIQMNRVKPGVNGLGYARLHDFKNQTRYWGAAYYPQLNSGGYVSVCNNYRDCSIITKGPASWAIAHQASNWWAIGAHYTASTVVSHPRPGRWETSTSHYGYQMPVKKFIPPVMGQFRSDTFVRALWQTGNAVPDSAFTGPQTPTHMFASFPRRGSQAIAPTPPPGKCE